MINGQLNMVSVPTVTQPVILEPAVPIAVTMHGAQQNGGDFAELLSGIRLQAKATDLPGSGESEAIQSNDSLALNTGAEDSVVDLLAQLTVSSRISPASEADVQKPDDSETTGVSADAVPLGGDPTDVITQMVLAAYSQPGRIPEVNIPTQSSVDRLQNVAAVLEHPATTPAPSVEKQAERVISKLLLQSDVAATFPTAAQQQTKSDRMPEAEIPSLVRVDRQQNAATVTEQPAVVPGPPVQKQTEHVTAEPHLQSDVAVSFPTAAQQQTKSDRMSDVNIPTQRNVDRLQKVATVTDQPALLSDLSDKIQLEQPAAEPVQASVALSAKTTTVPASDEPIAVPGTRTVDQPETQPEKTAASVTPKSGLPSAHTTAPLPAASPESEIEIQLSQPLPISARVTAAPVLADNQSAMEPEVRSTLQRLNPEQQIEKVRAGNELSVAKETFSSLQSAASGDESPLDSNTSHGSDNNQALTQNMSGQLKAEHPGVTAPSAKAVQADPARQGVPEQVVHQIKERLVQHDVKPGNQQITLTLSPDTLGELKMNLNLQGQKLSVEIITENRTVRDVIVQHTEALKESLARQNITMESFDVTTGGKGSGSQGQNQNAWRELAKQQEQQQFWTSPRGYQTAQADLPSGHAAYQRQQGNSMLDIHY